MRTMKRQSIMFRTAIVAGFVLGCGAANAQMARPYDPSAPVTQAPPAPPPSPAPPPLPGGPPVRRAPSAELKNLVSAQGIREVTVAPGESSVVIEFRAWHSLVPVVEIARERPVAAAGGRLEFANRLAKVDATPINNENEISPTGYTASVPNLEAGTRYHYLISAGDGPSLRQMRGRFTTAVVRASVTVVFTEIKVTNDSDDGGNGELAFKFFANYPTAEPRAYGNLASPDLSWNDNDPARRINEAIEVSDAPDRLELVVNGYDDDSVLGGGTGAELSEFEPLSRPINRTDLEANVARQTFSLRDFPGDDVRHDFTLESMPHAAGQGDLSFNVKGYFVIKREKASP